MLLKRSLRAVLSVLMLVPFALPAFANAIPGNDPMGVIRQGVSDVLAVFRDQQMPLPQRREKLRELSEQYFDFNDMARSALGYHWRELSPEQRSQFVPVF